MLKWSYKFETVHEKTDNTDSLPQTEQQVFKSNVEQETKIRLILKLENRTFSKDP